MHNYCCHLRIPEMTRFQNGTLARVRARMGRADRAGGGGRIHCRSDDEKNYYEMKAQLRGDTFTKAYTHKVSLLSLRCTGCLPPTHCRGSRLDTLSPVHVWLQLAAQLWACQNTACARGSILWSLDFSSISGVPTVNLGVSI